MAPTDRERRLAALRIERQRQRELERQQARATRQRVLVVGGSAVGLLALIAVGVLAVTQLGGGTSKVAASPEPELPCAYTPSSTSNSVVKTRPVAPGLGTRRNVRATLLTNQGTIVLSLLATDAKCATTSFVFLAEHGYFDGSPCNRLTTGGLQFLQCGDPAKGTGPGYTFPDENLTTATTYPTGTVGMANHGPDSNGSEFFMTYGPTKLDPDYTPFGTVVSGLDVLKKIAAGGSTPMSDGSPNIPTTILSVRTVTE